MTSEADMSFGSEIELGDVLKSLPIPEELGTWEFSETDFVNLREPYKFVAVDPLGISPPVGGEVNLKPTKTIAEQVDKIRKLITFFEASGYPPTSSAISFFHVHVHVKGLTENMPALRSLMRYIQENQKDAVEIAGGGFREYPDMKKYPRTVMYLKYDGGRQHPDGFLNNIINHSETFDDFVRNHCLSMDRKRMGRPLRYAINTYSLKHIGTVEFRMFRNTLDLGEIEDCLRFCRDFMLAALNSGPSVVELAKRGNYNFPRFRWSAAEYGGWINTRYDKSRGKKERKFYDV